MAAGYVHAQLLLYKYRVPAESRLSDNKRLLSTLTQQETGYAFANIGFARPTTAILLCRPIQRGPCYSSASTHWDDFARALNYGTGQLAWAARNHRDQRVFQRRWPRSSQSTGEFRSRSYRCSRCVEVSNRTSSIFFFSIILPHRQAVSSYDSPPFLTPDRVKSGADMDF